MSSTGAEAPQAPKGLKDDVKIRRVDWSPDEWLGGVYRLTDAERGVYMQILMGIYSHGGPIEIEDARAMCGRQFSTALKVLLDRGKLTLIEQQDDTNPAVTRQLLDNKRAAIELQRSRHRTLSAQQNAAKRWENNGVANAGASSAAYANHQLTTINHQPSSERNARESALPPAVLAREFNEWWEAYPHKVGKGAARTAFQKARRAGIDLQRMLDAIQTYVRNKPDDRPWCNPATWLNQERYSDEHDGPRPSVSGPPAPRTPAPKV
jgi:hypothetical protein